MNQEEALIHVRELAKRSPEDGGSTPRPCSTHFTWDITRNNRCPECNGPTVLVVAKAWSADSELDEYEAETGDAELAGEWVEVDEEITGHWCPKCHALRSLSLNS